MSAITLESLGLSKTELTDRVVDKCVDALLNNTITGCDEDGDEFEVTRKSSLYTHLVDEIAKRIDAAVAALADKYIMPDALKFIEQLTINQTNQWGEKKGEPFTLVEYMTTKANEFLNETVNYEGASKSSSRSSYDWRGTQTRLCHMIHKHLHYSIEQAVQSSMADAQSVLAESIADTARMKLREVADKISVTVNSK